MIDGGDGDAPLVVDARTTYDNRSQQESRRKKETPERAKEKNEESTARSISRENLIPRLSRARAKFKVVNDLNGTPSSQNGIIPPRVCCSKIETFEFVTATAQWNSKFKSQLKLQSVEPGDNHFFVFSKYKCPRHF
jgi:hypothetical protein